MTSIFIPTLNCSISFSIGKNAQNNIEILKNANNNDIWFHLDNQSSCYVIAHIPENVILNKKQKNKIITQGALLCKINSKFKSNKNVDICYSEVKNVALTDIPGTVNVSNKKNVFI
tara:strand:- start:892 stop:1239 length:348 start_codon:yes stop_codon:yes gene_type:complete